MTDLTNTATSDPVALSAQAATKSQLIAADIAAALRARAPVLWVVTKEETRAERYIMQAAANAAYTCRTFDVAQGAAEMSGKLLPDLVQLTPIGADPGEALQMILQRSQGGGDRCLWILRDFPIWLQGQPGARVMRLLRNIAKARPRMAQDNAQAIVILSPDSKVPDEISGHATVIDWPLPDRVEIAMLLDSTIETNKNKLTNLEAEMTNGRRDAAIDAALGLSEEETAAAYSTSLVKLRTIDALAVAKEKKRVIAKERVLEWHDPIPSGLDSVGGLENLKSWLVARALAWSDKARKYGLQAPKGCLLVGVPGCGKSLTAKAIATAWGIPLLRLDMGALKSKFVGESEANIRKAFKVIEAIGRCVVWIDEIEKALAGATQGGADGGVSTDALGSVLTWMQERQGESFVIATANEVESLPPELLRKGRFDEVWFVDLPTVAERKSILRATLKANGRKPDSVNVEQVAAACFRDSMQYGFTGAEVSAIVPDAMFAAFADNAREMTTQDLLNAAATVVPLAKTANEKIARLRQWATGRARPATAVETAAALELTGVEL